MTALSDSKRQLILFVLIGAVLGYGSHLLLVGGSKEHERILAMETAIKNLESALAEKETQLQALKPSSAPLTITSNPAHDGAPSALTEQDRGSPIQHTDNKHTQNATENSADILKDLETASDNDPRAFSEKLKEFLADNTRADKTAIASRSIFNMARDRDRLPDYTLQSIYRQQTDPDLKRTIAQVLAQRGDHTLLDQQISEAQTRLQSDQSNDRQVALNRLAKTRSARAVDAIAPYLLDPDVNVKLDALHALRDTGNQKHLSLIEGMTNDPDPAVSLLAADVSNHLMNLSSNARTTPATSDIEANLPPIMTP